MTAAERDALIVGEMPRVRAIAGWVQASIPVHVPLDDLIGAGTLGLIDGAERSTGDRGCRSYLTARIRGAMYDYLRKALAPRYRYQTAKAIQGAIEELERTLSRDPEPEEIAQKLGVTRRRYERMRASRVSLTSFTTLARTERFDRLTFGDLLASKADDPETAVLKSEQCERVRAAVKTLPERLQILVQLYFSAEMTLKEIAAVLGVNESRASQLKSRALQLLSEAMMLEPKAAAAAA